MSTMEMLNAFWPHPSPGAWSAEGHANSDTIDADNPCIHEGNVNMQATAVRYGMARSSTKPPHDDEEPEDNDEEDNIPEPAAPLPCCHVVHAPERPSEYARGL